MRLPRLSIGDIMGLTLLVALDCLAYLTNDAREDAAYFGLLFGVVPLANVLVLGHVALARRRRSGDPALGVVGFLTAGWLILVLHTLWAGLAPYHWRMAFDPIEVRLGPLVRSWFPVGWIVAMAVYAASILLPQLLAASLVTVLWRRGS
jgi:hypothetical protein